MQRLNDLSRSLTPFEPDGTLIAVIEMSLSSWLTAWQGKRRIFVRRLSSSASAANVASATKIVGNTKQKRSSCNQSSPGDLAQ